MAEQTIINLERNKVVQDFYAYVKKIVDERSKEAIADASQTLDDVLCVIDQEHDRCKRFYEQMKTEGFTVNAIEAEGAYRAMATLREELAPYYKGKDYDL